MSRPGGLELPTFWFVAIRVKMLNAPFGVAYGLETPFFPQLVHPMLHPKSSYIEEQTAIVWAYDAELKCESVLV